MTEDAWLALDTSTPTGSVAVGAGGAVLAEVALRVGSGHSSALMPAVDQAVRRAGLTPSELAGVVVGAGPGSFTGLRIAAATAKGIVAALEIPMLAYSSLLATAARAWAAERPVAVLFDARGRDVFAACYRFGAGFTVEEVMAPAAATVDEVIDRLRDGPEVWLLGEGAARHGEELLAALPGARLGPLDASTPSATGLLRLARAAPELGRVGDPAAWGPDYLRASGAERIAAREARLRGNDGAAARR